MAPRFHAKLSWMTSAAFVPTIVAPEDFGRVAVGDELHEPARIADGPRARHEREWHGLAPAAVASRDCFLLRHAHHRDLRVDEDGAGHHPMIHAPRLLT